MGHKLHTNKEEKYGTQPTHKQGGKIWDTTYTQIGRKNMGHNLHTNREENMSLSPKVSNTLLHSTRTHIRKVFWYRIL